MDMLGSDKGEEGKRRYFERRRANMMRGMYYEEIDMASR